LVTDIKCKKGLQITKRGNQKITKGELETVIVEGQTTQWPKEKVERDKQRSTKYYTENKRSSNTNLTKTGDKLRCSGRVSSSCSTCDKGRATPVINSVINSGAPEELAVPAPHVTKVVLLLF